MDAFIAARYPFSSFAKKYLKAGGADTIDSDAVDSAKQSIINAISAPERQARASSDSKSRMVSYALARVILAALGKPGTARKFANGEADAAAAKLDEEKEDVFFEVAKDFFPSLAGEDDEYNVSLADFLKCGSGLANAKIERGKVFLDKTELLGLLRSAIAFKIIDLPRIKPSEVPPLVREAIEEADEWLPSETFRGTAGGRGGAGEIEGKYLDLSCVKKIRAGLEEGRRYYGSMALAIACLRDGLAKDDAKKVMEEYVANCRRSTHPFTAREASATLDWVYKHPTLRFSCRTMKENGLLDDYCEACLFRYKTR